MALDKVETVLNNYLNIREQKLTAKRKLILEVLIKAD